MLGRAEELKAQALVEAQTQFLGSLHLVGGPNVSMVVQLPVDGSPFSVGGVDLYAEVSGKELRLFTEKNVSSTASKNLPVKTASLASELSKRKSDFEKASKIVADLQTRIERGHEEDSGSLALELANALTIRGKHARSVRKLEETEVGVCTFEELVERRVVELKPGVGTDLREFLPQLSFPMVVFFPADCCAVAQAQVNVETKVLEKRVVSSIPQFLGTRLSTHLALTDRCSRVDKIAGNGAWNANVLGSRSVVGPNKLLGFSILISNSCAMVGWAPPTLSPNAINQFTVCGFYLSTANGRLYSQFGDNSRSFANNRIPDGSVISSLYDEVAGTLSFRCTGLNSERVAFNYQVPAGMQPAIILREQGGSAQFLPYQQCLS